MSGAETRGTVPVSPRAAEDRRARRLRWAFVALLVVALAQVVWWMFDQARLMDDLTSRLTTEVAQERDAAERLLKLGVDPGELAGGFPNLEFDGDVVRVSAEWLAELESERRGHLNQYRWEGGFFLTVLLLGLVVMSRAMSREVELRRRQENFLAAVTHELKSPLAALRLGLETIGRRPDMESERRGRTVTRALADADRLEGLIENVLATSRLEDGAVLSEPEDLGLALAVANVVDSTSKVESSGCAVRQEVPDHLTVRASATAVATVLRNLLDNAIEATRSASSPTVAISGHAEGADVVLRVEDNGVGFDPGLAERLFEKFYRPGDEMTRGRSGSGLGLFLVRRLVELDGGRVKAESDGPGAGACFEVRWPAGRESMDGAGGPSSTLGQN